MLAVIYNQFFQFQSREMKQIKFSSKLAYHGAKGHGDRLIAVKAHKACHYGLEVKCSH